MDLPGETLAMGFPLPRENETELLELETELCLLEVKLLNF